MAAVLASPVYELLGNKGLGTPGNYLTDPMPPTLTLIGGQLAWRQHEGGHDVTPNWPAFFGWVSNYIASSPPVQSTTAPTTQADSAAVPSPRTDANSMLAHQQLVAKAKAGGIDLYFLGDSITRRWGCSDPQWSEMLANWKQNFFGWNAANFGWGGDRIQNMLWRIQNGELDGVNPKVIVILAGTNNVGNQFPARRKKVAGKVADIVNGIRALIETCREKAPLRRLFSPRSSLGTTTPQCCRKSDVSTMNSRSCADERQIFYLNINDKLANSRGGLFEGMTVDKLHLTAKGYQAWADGLRRC